MSALNLQILVVEDQADIAYGLKMYFDAKGHEVSVALDAASARAKAAEKRFDIVLCDLVLPDGNGWDLLPHLRSQGPVRAIAISGHNSDQDLARSKAAGFIMHLAKPVAMAELDRVFAEVMKSDPNAT